jgi:hypothetical protein
MISFHKARLVCPFDLKVNLDAETVFRAKPDLKEYKKNIPHKKPKDLKAQDRKKQASNVYHKSKHGQTYGLF